MSEAAQPLSRRERRAMEAAARAAEGDVTQALPVTLGAEPEAETTLSRRERRRMERLASPVETWTREEELIATGQMPAMTDEVLAEQDRLAAERAEAEARAAEAFAATAPQSSVEFVAQQPDAVVEPSAEAEPSASFDNVPAEPAPSDTVPQPDPEPLPSQPSEPLPATAPEPAPEPASEPQPEPAPAPEAEHDMSHIPADLRHLFPPGSLQARSFQAQEPARAPSPASNPDAADEIRRLTQEAMAGITKATTEAVPIVDPQPEPERSAEQTVDEAPADQQAPEYVAEPAVHEDAPVFEAIAATDDAPDVPNMADGVDVEALWNAPTIDEPLRSPLAPAAFTDVDPEPVTLAEAPLVADVPVPSQVETGSAPQAPVWSALVPAQPPVEPQAVQPAVAPTGFAPVTTAEPAPPAPTVWDTHPLTNPGVSPVRELPAEPVQRELPRPDLTALLATQPNPSVGQAPYASNEPATSPGALPQRPAEPRAGGGARHFRWAHLAVIGAIAFVLGVVVWNVARSS